LMTAQDRISNIQANVDRTAGKAGNANDYWKQESEKAKTVETYTYIGDNGHTYTSTNAEFIKNDKAKKARESMKNEAKLRANLKIERQQKGGLQGFTSFL
jgi:hypothetical protein